MIYYIGNTIYQISSKIFTQVVLPMTVFIVSLDPRSAVIDHVRLGVA